MLRGDEGEAAKLAMEILVKVGGKFGAKRLVPVASAHIVLAMYKSIFDAGVEVCEKFAAMGAKFRVPTTLDPSGMDTQKWQEFKTPAAYAEKQLRVAKAYEQMGAIMSWTCLPHFNGSAPRVGWTESSAVAFINSILGARSNRETAVLDVCIGITGRTPEYGLHLQENRYGKVLVKMELGGRTLETWEYPVLGYFLGKTLGSEIGVVDGMAGAPKMDELKSMLAAAAASGPLAMIHLVGITPEARTRAEAFGPNQPEHTVTVTEEILKKTRDEMCTVKSAKIDLVALGCPHYSITEIQNVMKLLAGRKVAADTELWIYTTKQVRDLADRMGIMTELLALGGKLATETCMLISPVETWGFKTLMTDSGKCSYYAPVQCKTDVIFGSAAECVEAAVKGRVLAPQQAKSRLPGDPVGGQA
jgi:predicted aconitase